MPDAFALLVIAADVTLVKAPFVLTACFGAVAGAVSLLVAGLFESSPVGVVPRLVSGVVLPALLSVGVVLGLVSGVVLPALLSVGVVVPSVGEGLLSGVLSGLPSGVVELP